MLFVRPGTTDGALSRVDGFPGSSRSGGSCCGGTEGPACSELEVLFEPM